VQLGPVTSVEGTTSSTASGACALVRVRSDPDFSSANSKILDLANAIALDSELIVAPRQIAGREMVASVVAVNDICPRRQELEL